MMRQLDRAAVSQRPRAILLVGLGAVVIIITAQRSRLLRVETGRIREPVTMPAPAVSAPSPLPPETIHPARVAAVGDPSDTLRAIAAHDESAVPELAALLAGDAAPALQRDAAAILATMGTPVAVDALLRAIVAASEHRRGELLPALGHLTKPEAAPALVALLLQQSDPALVGPVRDALARVADGPGVLEVVKTFRESTSESWQEANLMGVILRVHSPDAVPVLREVVLRDTNPSLQAQAALALGQIGNDESAAALAAALEQTRSAALKEVVTDSLARITPRR